MTHGCLEEQAGRLQAIGAASFLIILHLSSHPAWTRRAGQIQSGQVQAPTLRASRGREGLGGRSV